MRAHFARCSFFGNIFDTKYIINIRKRVILFWFNNVERLAKLDVCMPDSNKNFCVQDNCSYDIFWFDQRNFFSQVMY